MRRTSVFGLLALAVATALVCPAAVAQEQAADRDAILKQIAELRDKYRVTLDGGEKNDDLRNLLRDLNTATSSSDWDHALELLAKYAAASGRPAGGATEGAEGAAERWPVRTSATEPVPEDPFVVEKLTYEGVGGIKLGALVFRPKPATPKADEQPAPAKCPVVIVAHGGFRGVPLADRRLAEALAKVGYLVFVPEFRGQGQSEGKVEYGAGEVLDLLSAIEFVESLEDADAKRLGVVGSGHGGLVTLLALARAEGVLCAATISAPTDLTQLARDSNLFTRELKLNRVPLRLTDQNLLRQCSPLFYASGVQVPVLLMHGGKDVVVPAKHAEGYAGVLKARGKEVQLEIYVSAGEDLVSKLPVYHVDMQDFLAERLKPHGWTVVKKKPADQNQDDRKKPGEPRGGQPRHD